MNKFKILHLLLDELRRTYRIEKLILDAFAHVYQDSGTWPDPLQRYIVEAEKRLRRFEEQCIPSADSHAVDMPSSADVAFELDALIGTLEGEGRDAAINLALHRIRRHFLARYDMLTSWSGLLADPTPAAALMAVLAEEMIAFNASLDGSSAASQKGSSLGERLTALLERNR